MMVTGKNEIISLKNCSCGSETRFTCGYFSTAGDINQHLLKTYGTPCLSASELLVSLIHPLLNP
jgi:hypothetical protein